MRSSDLIPIASYYENALGSAKREIKLKVCVVIQELKRTAHNTGGFQT